MRTMRYKKTEKLNKAIFDFLKNGKKISGAYSGFKDKEKTYQDVKTSSKDILRPDIKSSSKDTVRHTYNNYFNGINQTHIEKRDQESHHKNGGVQHGNQSQNPGVANLNSKAFKRKDLKSSTNPFKKPNSVHNIREKNNKIVTKFSQKKTSMPVSYNHHQTITVGNLLVFLNKKDKFGESIGIVANQTQNNKKAADQTAKDIKRNKSGRTTRLAANTRKSEPGNPSNTNNNKTSKKDNDLSSVTALAKRLNLRIKNSDASLSEKIKEGSDGFVKN